MVEHHGRCPGGREDWYTSSNAFSDNRKPRTARKGVIEGWYLNRGFRTDILAGDLECIAHHSVTRRWEKSEVEGNFQIGSELCTRRRIRRWN